MVQRVRVFNRGLRLRPPDNSPFWRHLTKKTLLCCSPLYTGSTEKATCISVFSEKTYILPGNPADDDEKARLRGFRARVIDAQRTASMRTCASLRTAPFAPRDSTAMVPAALAKRAQVSTSQPRHLP